MDARTLTFGDVVKYHKTILQLVGIKKGLDTGSFEHDFSAIYKGHYAVQAMVNDESIEPVAITPELLEKCGFESFLGIENRQCWLHKQTGLILRGGGFGIYELDLENGPVAIEWNVRWIHQLQQAMRLAGMVDPANHIGEILQESAEV